MLFTRWGGGTHGPTWIGPCADLYGRCIHEHEGGAGENHLRISEFELFCGEPYNIYLRSFIGVKL